MSKDEAFGMELMDLIERHHPGALEGEPSASGKVIGAIAVNLGGLLAIIGKTRGQRTAHQVFRYTVARIKENQVAIQRSAMLEAAEKPVGAEGCN